MKRMVLRLSVMALGLALQACPPVIETPVVVPGLPTGETQIIDHRYAHVTGLTHARVEAAKSKLNVKYWHTSHGSQISSGIAGMNDFYGTPGLYSVSKAPTAGEMKYDDTEWTDLGNGNFNVVTRDYLEANPLVNVVMWSWCGQVSGSDEADIASYLAKMSALETEFPGVRFVYMTGHADGTGSLRNLHLRNRQIRDYCVANGKFLFDFYDIECYDPDGVYYGDRFVTDGCNYDANGDGHVSQGSGDPGLPQNGDKSWALDWQAAHPDGWWECNPAHTVDLNGNQKAKAAWQLFAKLAESLP